MHEVRWVRFCCPMTCSSASCKSSRSLDGITLSHRIADSPPEEVAVHTHLEAHFVLVTSGRYVSSASADPNRKVTLVYNPPGTTHRDDLTVPVPETAAPGAYVLTMSAYLQEGSNLTPISFACPADVKSAQLILAGPQVGNPWGR